MLLSFFHFLTCEFHILPTDFYNLTDVGHPGKRRVAVLSRTNNNDLPS